MGELDPEETNSRIPTPNEDLTNLGEEAMPASEVPPRTTGSS